MIRRIGIALGGAAIGAVLGWTIAIFTGWAPAVAIAAIAFGLLAVFNDERENPGPPHGNRPTTLFPPES